MSIVTKSDVKKFIALAKAELKNGTRKELTNYSSAVKHDGIDVIKEYYPQKRKTNSLQFG